MKLDKKTIGLVLMVAMVVAQHFGVVPTDAPTSAEPCPECARCGETEVDGGR